MPNLDKFKKKNLLERSLKKTESSYRPYDPGWYLYREVLNFNKDKFSKEFIELVYVTLAAWNMNSRGAKLNDFHLFSKTIKDNKKLLLKLENKTIKNIGNTEIENILRELFFNFKLVYEGKPLLVTFSKFLHFYFPKLLVPIDRTYTLNYFFGHTNIPPKLDGQFKKFLQIEGEFSGFYKETNLKKYKTNDWNLCETKIMDNMIIGYIKLKKEKGD